MPHEQQQSQFPWVHTKTGPGKVGDVVRPHLVLGRPQGRFSVGVASRTCLANLSCGILGTWPNQRSWDLSIRKSAGLTARALRISDLRCLSRSVTPRILRKYPTSAVCSKDIILSVVT